MAVKKDKSVQKEIKNSEGFTVRNRRRLDSASRLLLDRHPFYGHLIMQMKRMYDRDLTTYSSINVRDRSIILFLHPDIEELPLHNIAAIMENACLYLVLGYLKNRKYIENEVIDGMSSAIAANELNSWKQLMVEMGSPSVKDFPGFNEKDTKEYYRLKIEELMEKFGQQFKMESPMPGPGEGGDDGEPQPGNNGEPQVDDNAPEIPRDSQGQGMDSNQAMAMAMKSGGSGEPGDDSDGESEAEEIKDAKDLTDKLSERVFKEILQHGKMTETDPDTGAVKQVIKNAMQEAFKKSRGVTPGNVSKLISEILETQTMPWNVILRRQMQKSVKFESTKTWMRESRRMPGVVKGKKFDHRCNIYILLDTSGSCTSDKIISVFSNEMKTMTKHGHKVYVVPCDTQVHTPYLFSDRIHVWEGGGGTTLYPGMKWIKDEAKERPDLCIILTDGMCDVFPKPPFPTIWALLKNCKAPVDWGMQINLKED